MDTGNDVQNPSRSTQSRSIRLTHEISARLQAVCDHLGVTVGSYLTAEIGRAVCRDEISLSVKNTQNDAMAMLAAAIADAQEHPTE